jgi:hypothetical protein
VRNNKSASWSLDSLCTLYINTTVSFSHFLIILDQYKLDVNTRIASADFGSKHLLQPL